MSNSLCSVDICFVDVVVDGPFDHYADHAKKPFLLLVFLVSINLFHSSPNECFMCLPVISLADFFLSFSPQFLMRLRQHHAYNLYVHILMDAVFIRQQQQCFTNKDQTENNWVKSSIERTTTPRNEAGDIHIMIDTLQLLCKQFNKIFDNSNEP